MTCFASAPRRYWETVQRLKINQFYGAPTAIRLLMKYDQEFVKKYDRQVNHPYVFQKLQLLKSFLRSSLKTLGSVGEPMNLEAWNWYHGVVGDGKCDLVDTW